MKKNKFQIGLKIWSTNVDYISDINKYYGLQVFNYIELYIVPGTLKEYSKIWSDIDIPYIIHAPHSLGGLNPAKKEDRTKNYKTFKEITLFADKLQTDIIICHPGIDGAIEETVFQFNKFEDNRIIVENKPFIGIDGVSKCNGSTPEEIKYIKDNTGAGFCLDFGHAICSANANHIKPIELITDFLNLNPDMFHLSDGDFESITDKHLHFGKGNFPLRDILNFLPSNSIISIETEKDNKNDLHDFLQDIHYIKKFYN